MALGGGGSRLRSAETRSRGEGDGEKGGKKKWCVCRLRAASGSSGCVWCLAVFRFLFVGGRRQAEEAKAKSRGSAPTLPRVGLSRAGPARRLPRAGRLFSPTFYSLPRAGERHRPDARLTAEALVAMCFCQLALQPGVAVPLTSARLSGLWLMTPLAPSVTA